MNEPRPFSESLYDGMSSEHILSHIILAPGPGLETATLPAHFWNWERHLPRDHGAKFLALYLQLRWFVQRYGPCLTTTESIAEWLGLPAWVVDWGGTDMLDAGFLAREESAYRHPETGRLLRGADRIVVLEVPPEPRAPLTC